MDQKIMDILKLVLTYFWEIFKYWEILPADLAEKIEKEAADAAE